MKHTFTLTYAESNVLFFLILFAVPQSGKCQLLSFMASKIGWIMKGQWKLASRWRSLVKSFGFRRFLSLHHYLSILLPSRVSAFTHLLICVYIFKNIYLNLERILFLFKCRLDTLCS